MQYDGQQQNTDPAQGQGNPFDPFDTLRDASGGQTNTPQVPGGQATQQRADDLQQQDQQGMGNLGGVGEMVGQQGTTPGQQVNAGASGNIDALVTDPNRRAKAGNDPNNPYGRIDDIIADYSRQQKPEENQQNPSNW